MYEEDFVRIGNDGRRMSYGKARRSGEAWNALAEFAKKFMEEYYPNDEEVRRSYNRYVGEDEMGYMPSERNPMSHRGGRHDYISGEHSFYRGQPRTASGRFKRVRFGHEDSGEMEKEEIGASLAHAHGREWLVEKAIEEASEFIKAATKNDEYEMFKEFCELCVLMKGVAEFVPADLEEQACYKALEYYSKKAGMMRYSNPLLDEYSRNAHGWMR